MSRIPGPLRTDGRPAWLSQTDSGTLARLRSGSPGPLNHAGQQLAVHRPRHDATAPRDGYGELLIIQGKEWVKFLASTGANATGPIKDTLTDLYPILRKLGLTGRAAIKTYKDKEYVIIAGKAGLRKILTGTRYAADNPKVADLVIGSARMAEGATKGTALAIALVAADDVLEAVLDDQDLLSRQLGFTILADAGKQVIGGIAALIVGAGVAALGAPVVVPIAAGIVVGIVVGKVLDSYFPTDQIVMAMNDYYNRAVDGLYQYATEAVREMIRSSWPSGVPCPY